MTPHHDRWLALPPGAQRDAFGAEHADALEAERVQLVLATARARDAAVKAALAEPPAGPLPPEGPLATELRRLRALNPVLAATFHVNHARAIDLEAEAVRASLEATKGPHQ